MTVSGQFSEGACYSTFVSSQLMHNMLVVYFLLLLLLPATSEIPAQMNIGVTFTQCSIANSESVVNQATLLTQFQIEIALRMAISEINNKSDQMYDDVLPETALQPHYLAFNTSTTYLETFKMMQEFPSSGLSAAVGPEGNSLWKVLPYYAENDIFSVGYNSIDDVSGFLSNSMHLNPAVELEGVLLASVAAQYQFHSVVVFYSSAYVENYFTFWNFKNDVQQFDDMTIVKEIDVNGLSDADLALIVEECTQFNVYMVFMHSFEAVSLFEALYRASFFRPNLQLLGSSLVMSRGMWENNATTLSHEEIATIMSGFIGLDKQCTPLETDFASRLQQYQKQLQAMPSTSNSPCFEQFENVSGITSSAVHAYNAVLAVAMGLHTTVLGPQSCKRVNISVEHDLFEALNATSQGERELTAALLQQVIEECTPYNDSSIHLNLDDTTTNNLFSLINFDPEKYFEDLNSVQGNTNSASTAQALQFLCPATQLPGVRVIGAVDASSHSFISCQEYSRTKGNNLSVSCSETVIFNTEDNTVPSDYTFKQNDTEMDSYATVLYIFLGLGIVLTLFCGLVIHNNRELRIVRIAQPEFLYILIIGILLNYGQGILIIRHSLQCFLLLWVASLTNTMILAPLVVSVWRMHVVLNLGMKRSKVTIPYTMKIIFTILGAKVVLLASYTARGYSCEETMLVTSEDPSGDEDSYCSNLLLNNERDLLLNFIGLLNILFDIVLFIGGIFYAYSAKKTSFAANLANRTLSGEK